MNILTTRFGLIQACESDLITIPDGLLGFRSFTQYLLLPDPVVAGLSWLQSVTAPELAFALVPPRWRWSTIASRSDRAIARPWNSMTNVTP